MFPELLLRRKPIVTFRDVTTILSATSIELEIKGGHTIPAKQAINLTDAFPSLSSNVLAALERVSSAVLSIPPRTVRRSLRLESDCSRCRWRSVVEL